jgi:hypothetical protein
VLPPIGKSFFSNNLGHRFCVYVVLKETTGEAEGCGFFEDEDVDVGDGQTQNMQQSSC